MRVWSEENMMSLETTVYVVFKRVIHKTVYDAQGRRIADDVLCAHCPKCKHFATCEGSKVWYAKQLGVCRDFETE